MISLGNTLQAERIRQGLSLEAVSARIKVPVRQLQLLEDQHYEKLPGAFLARNFALQYAECLGLSRQQVEPDLQAISALFQPVPAMRARPEFGGKIDLLRIARDQPRLHPLLMPLLWLLFAMLAVLVIYKMYQRGGTGASRSSVPAEFRAGVAG